MDEVIKLLNEAANWIGDNPVPNSAKQAQRELVAELRQKAQDLEGKEVYQP